MPKQIHLAIFQQCITVGHCLVEGFGAQAAGIRPFQLDSWGNILDWGDIIVALDGTPIRSQADLLRLLRGRKRGETVSVKVVRGGVDSAKVVDVPVAVK